LDGGVSGCPECSSANKAVGLYADASMESYLQIYALVLLRGILSFIFGLLVLFHPQRTLLILLQLVGTFCLIEGVFLVIA
jgi:uncharacterized membrane protein HdeD (DUF308 family)